jgi:hypothetical protein
MSEINRVVKYAFDNGLQIQRGNTYTTQSGVYLYGKCIILRMLGNKIGINLQELPTRTALSRISGVLGIQIYKKNHVVYYINSMGIPERVPNDGWHILK